MDAELGRFLTPDPQLPDANTGANINRYWYADNNPVRNVDPDGAQAVDSAGNTAVQAGCGSNCTMMNIGGKQYWGVGGGTAADSFLANQSGGTLSEYTVTTRKDWANAFGLVNDISTGLSFIPAFTGPAKIVSTITGRIELFLDPSPENLVAAGIGKASKFIPDKFTSNAVQAGAIAVGNKDNIQSAAGKPAGNGAQKSSSNQQFPAGQVRRVDHSAAMQKHIDTRKPKE